MIALSYVDTTTPAASLIATDDGGGGGVTGLITLLIVGLGILIIISVLRAQRPTVVVLQNPVASFARAIMFGLVVGAIAFGALYFVFTSASSFAS